MNYGYSNIIFLLFGICNDPNKEVLLNTIKKINNGLRRVNPENTKKRNQTNTNVGSLINVPLSSEKTTIKVDTKLVLEDMEDRYRHLVAKPNINIHENYIQTSKEQL